MLLIFRSSDVLAGFLGHDRSLPFHLANHHIIPRRHPCNPVELELEPAVKWAAELDLDGTSQTSDDVAVIASSGVLRYGITTVS